MEARWGFCVFWLSSGWCVRSGSWINLQLLNTANTHSCGGGVLCTSRTSAAQQLGQKGAFSCVPPPVSLMSSVWASFRGIFFLFQTQDQAAFTGTSEPSRTTPITMCWTPAECSNWDLISQDVFSISNNRLVPSFLIFAAVSSSGGGDDTLSSWETGAAATSTPAQTWRCV